MARKSVLKPELLCRKCGASWVYQGTTQNTQCPFCGAAKDARDRSAEAKLYFRTPERIAKLKIWNEDADNRRNRGKKSRDVLRKRVFFKICGGIHPTCVRCGCDDVRFLEINHKNGGGNKEMQKGEQSTRFYYDIALGRRATTDLELLCKACNAIHALELRFGVVPLMVYWRPE